MDNGNQRWLSAPRSLYSLDTCNWEEASRKLLELTTHKTIKEPTIAEAVADFIADCGRQNLKPQTKKRPEVSLRGECSVGVTQKPPRKLRLFIRAR